MCSIGKTQGSAIGSGSPLSTLLGEQSIGGGMSQTIGGNSGAGASQTTLKPTLLGSASGLGPAALPAPGSRAPGAPPVGGGGGTPKKRQLL